MSLWKLRERRKRLGTSERQGLRTSSLVLLLVLVLVIIFVLHSVG